MSGGGTGIGRAIALALARAGYDVTIGGRRAEPLAETVGMADGSPGDVRAVVCDITVDDDRARLVEASHSRSGRVDLLVNNAATSVSKPLLDVGIEEWRSVFACNVEAPFFLSQRVAPLMRDLGGGRIVNISSIYGRLAMDGVLYEEVLPQRGLRGPVRQPAYHASKGAIANLTRELAAALGPWRITVNAVSPGMVRTPGSAPFLTSRIEAELERRTPVGRLGTPEEIAAAVLFLASEEAGFVTGLDLAVDGGWMVW